MSPSAITLHNLYLPNELPFGGVRNDESQQPRICRPRAAQRLQVEINLTFAQDVRLQRPRRALEGRQCDEGCPPPAAKVTTRLTLARSTPSSHYQD